MVGPRQPSTVPPPSGGRARSTTPRSVTTWPGRRGVSWRRAPTGGWEVAGVDPVLCRLFSQRAASIDESAYRTSAGRGSAAASAGWPSTPTGRSKDRTVTADELRTGWRRRASIVGLDTGALVRVVGRRPPSDPALVIDRGAAGRRLGAPGPGPDPGDGPGPRGGGGRRRGPRGRRRARPTGRRRPRGGHRSLRRGGGREALVDPSRSPGPWPPMWTWWRARSTGTGPGSERTVTRRADGVEPAHRAVGDELERPGRRPPGRQR